MTALRSHDSSIVSNLLRRYPLLPYHYDVDITILTRGAWQSRPDSRPSVCNAHAHTGSPCSSLPMYSVGALEPESRFVAPA